MLEKLGFVWSELERSARSNPLELDALRMSETEAEMLGGGILVGIDARGGRHLLVPCAQDAARTSDRRSAGVHLLVKPLIQEGKERLFIDVACKLPGLNAVFTHLVRDLLTKLEQRGSPWDTCRQVLDEWRELLGAPRRSRLGMSEIVGLFGELFVLGQLAVAGDSALEWWTGKDAGLRDFVCGKLEIEVKTTTATTGWSIEVNDLNQLEPAPSSRLLLHAIRLRETPGKGSSLPGLIEQLTAKGLNRAALLSAMQKRGYQVADADDYASVTFEVVEQCSWTVDEGFPRLSKRDFKSGRPSEHITKVRYTLDLNASLPSRLRDGGFGEELAALTGGGAR